MVSLLPPNATLLERNLAEVCAPSALGNTADTIKTVSWVRPGGYSPYLAAQWRLGEFAGYFASSEDLIDSGLPWLRMRGTAAAVQAAMSWINLGAVIEEDGARLHIDPGTTDITAKLENIKQLVAASIPAHVWLYRLYHGYDIRHLQWDRSRWDQSIWDDDSGEWVSSVKISNATRIAHRPLQAARAARQTMTWRLTRVVQRDAYAWDRFAWDDYMRLMDAGSTLTRGIGSAVGFPARRALARLSIVVSHTTASEDGQPETQYTNRISMLAPAARPVRSWSGQWAGAWRQSIYGTFNANGG